MKVLIIGSKGFIGSHLLSFYRDKGFQTYGCDVIIDYTDDFYFQIEISNPTFKDVFSSISFDLCVNCSGAASVPNSITNPLQDFHLNTYNVFQILDSIRLYCPKSKFINLSSAAVYGNPISLPIKESHTLNPVSPYGKHKKMAEDICKEFTSDFGLRTCNLRIFSAYGDGLKKQLLWDLYQKTSMQSIDLFGTGEETRDFIYISDLINVIDIVARKTNFIGECINAGNGEQIKIKDLVKIFLKELNCTKIVNFKGSNRKGDPLYWEADITCLKNMGYMQNTNLENGIKHYIRWVQENL